MTQDEIDAEVEHFKHRNYLYLDNLDKDTPIYRVLPFETLLELLNESKLTLVKTKLWEDPYENYLLKCNAFLSDGTPVGIEHLQEQLFGQCWTLTPESDALWRIYSYETKGIRIKTTINKLFNVVFDKHSRSSLINSFIGKVRYASKQAIQNHFSQPQNTTPIMSDTSAQLMIDAQLWKRAEFQHENEIRVLYYVDSRHNDRLSNIKKFDIIPNDLIDEITLDPRIAERNRHIYTETLKKLGYTGAISKSELYKLDPVNIRLT